MKDFYKLFTKIRKLRGASTRKIELHTGYPHGSMSNLKDGRLPRDSDMVLKLINYRDFTINDRKELLRCFLKQYYGKREAFAIKVINNSEFIDEEEKDEYRKLILSISKIF